MSKNRRYKFKWNWSVTAITWWTLFQLSQWSSFCAAVWVMSPDLTSKQQPLSVVLNNASHISSCESYCNRWIPCHKQRKRLQNKWYFADILEQTRDTLLSGKVYLIQKVLVEIFTVQGSESHPVAILDSSLHKGLLSRHLSWVSCLIMVLQTIGYLWYFTWISFSLTMINQVKSPEANIYFLCEIIRNRYGGWLNIYF